MHIVCYADGLEVAASENGEGMALESYKIQVKNDGPLDTRSVRREPSPAFRGRRFTTIEGLVAALRRELGSFMCWTTEDDRALRNLVKSGRRDEVIAEELSRDVADVGRRMRELGIE